MKKLAFLIVFATIFCALSAQPNRINRLLEYMPAPGQFINNPSFGTPAAAQQVVEGNNHYVSLGAWGGCIVFAFAEAVKNNPANPYGVDFTIFGNSFDGSSEAGIVWVMKDENSNGLPDDTWYEIAGSASFHPSVKRNYRITWQKEEDGSVLWTDNEGNSDYLLKNEYHAQSYYPNTQHFNNYPPHSVTMEGTLLPFEYFIENDKIILPVTAFGYADNRPINQDIDRSIPDNPYTPDVVEGAGGDAIDISWAIDKNGNYVDLDEIHFVKIVTGVMANAGALGEVSTEISDIVATKPGTTTTSRNLTVIHPHSPTMLVGDEMKIYAFYFGEGRKAANLIVFENSDGSKADIRSDGTVIAKAGGLIRVSAYPQGVANEKQSTEIYIREPKTVKIQGVENSFYAGSSISVVPTLYDQDNEEITNMEWIISVENEDIIHVEKLKLTGLKSGQTTLTLYPAKYPALSQEFRIEIKPAADKINIRVTAKTTDENLLPLKRLSLSPASINPFVENRQNDYSAPDFVSLAYVVAAALQNAEVNFKFRDDAAADSKLYLYSVENDGLFTYGWGGKTEPAAYARAWIVRHNSQSYLNNFDKIPVANGDTVVLYHTNSILSNWELSFIVAHPDSAAINDKITLTYQTFVCLFQNRTIIESAGNPQQNKIITMNDNANMVAITDNRGKATITLEQNPPLILRSGNDAVYIDKILITNVNQIASGRYFIYPNPVADKLYIGGATKTCYIKISDISGRVVLSTNITVSDNHIPVGQFNRGIYLLHIDDGTEIIRFKFIKH